MGIRSNKTELLERVISVCLDIYFETTKGRSSIEFLQCLLFFGKSLSIILLNKAHKLTYRLEEFGTI